MSLIRLAEILRHILIISKHFDDLENKYKNIKKSSYANIYQITTIDKSKIVNPMNHLDPIKRIKAPDSVMDKIDKGIIEAFTQTKEKQQN